MSDLEATSFVDSSAGTANGTPGEPSCSASDACECSGVCDSAVLIHRYSFTDIASGILDGVGDADGSINGEGEQGAGRLLLDGTNYVELPAEIVQGLSDVTFEVWFVSSDPRPWERVFDFGESLDGSGKSYLFLTPQTPSANAAMHVAFRPAGGAERTLKGAPAAVAGQLMHVVVVFDGTNGQMLIYNDGVLSGSRATNGQFDEISVQQCWLGKSLFSGDPPFRGQFDEFRVYDGVIDPERVANHFTMGPDQVSP